VKRSPLPAASRSLADQRQVAPAHFPITDSQRARPRPMPHQVGGTATAIEPTVRLAQAENIRGPGVVALSVGAPTELMVHSCRVPACIGASHVVRARCACRRQRANGRSDPYPRPSAYGVPSAPQVMPFLSSLCRPRYSIDNDSRPERARRDSHRQYHEREFDPARPRSRSLARYVSSADRGCHLALPRQARRPAASRVGCD